MLKNITPSLPEFGKIKAGMKEEEITISANNVKYHRGIKLDHYLITETEREENGVNFILNKTLMDSLKKDKSLLDSNKNLISIPIRLLYNDINLNFNTRNACYVGGRCVCSGDGETAKTRDKRDVKCPCNKIEPEYDGKDKCKPNGKLFAVIEGTKVVGACHVLRTTSINTVRSILGSLTFIQASTGGLLAFLPLHLMLKPITVTPGGKSRIVYISSIVFRGSIDQLQTKALEMAKSKAQYLVKMDAVEDQARITLATTTESPQEERDVQEEFYPDNIDTQDAEVVETEKTESETSTKTKLDIAKESIDKKNESIEKVKTEQAEDIPFDSDETKEPKTEDKSKIIAPGEVDAPAKMITKDQKTQIVKLKKEFKIATGAPWEKLLKPFDVKTANDLTFDQAEKFIESLKSNPT